MIAVVVAMLVAEAQRANPNVRTAGLRIMEARAQLGIAGSALYPQIQQATGELLWAREQRSNGKALGALGTVLFVFFKTLLNPSVAVAFNVGFSGIVSDGANRLTRSSKRTCSRELGP